MNAGQVPLFVKCNSDFRFVFVQCTYISLDLYFYVNSYFQVCFESSHYIRKGVQKNEF